VVLDSQVLCRVWGCGRFSLRVQEGVTVPQRISVSSGAVVQSFSTLVLVVVLFVVSGVSSFGASAVSVSVGNVTVATPILPAAGPLDSSSMLAPSAVGGGSVPLNATGTLTTFLAPSIIDLPQANTFPAQRQESIAYDSERSKDVLFGGISSSGSVSASTYTFDGDTWTKQSPASSPPARYDAAMVFDPATGTTVLFGGISSSGSDLGDTWVWDGSNWTQKTPSSAPSAREGAQAAYLPSLGKVVLFGGKSSGTYQSDTWTWDGTNWTHLSPSSAPPARAQGGLAYSGSSGSNLVLYGGVGTSGVLGDTWTFNGTNWTQQSPAGTPGPLDRFAFTYDPTLDVPVLQGGYDGVDDYANLWIWDGSTWDENAGNIVSSPGSQTGWLDGAMATVPTNGQLVLVGGIGADGTYATNAFKIDYPDSGYQPSYDFQSHNLTDQSADNVNLANQNLIYHQTDLQVNGVGLELVIERNFQGLVGSVSHLYPQGWTGGALDVSSYPLPHGALILGPDGHEYYFAQQSDGSYKAPAGADLSLSVSGSTSTLTLLHPDITYTLTSGYVTKITDRNGNTITVSRNGSNQITGITDTQGRSYSVAYDASGFLGSVTDPTGRKITYGYTSGALTSAALSDPNDPSGTATTTYGYPTGAVWPLTKVTTAAGRVDKYSYTDEDRLSSIVRVLTGTGDPTWTFNHTGTLGSVTETDPNDHVWTYKLDESQTNNNPDHLARITRTTDPNGHTHDSTYDASSNLASFNGENTSAVFNLTYSSNNNLTKFTSPSSNGTNTPASTSFSYQAPGQLYLPSSTTDPRGNCRSFFYDSNGNLTDVYDGQATGCDGKTAGTHLIDKYQGDLGVSCGGKTGELCSTTNGNGNTTSYSYDTNGNLTTISPPSPLGGSTITTDSLGRIASVIDGKGQKTSFTYDKADRITQILYNGTTSCDAQHATCIQYSYDKDGNLTSRVSNIGTTTYVYDNLGRLTDKNLPGPLVDNCTGFSGMHLTYDAAGNLATYCDGYGIVTYGYDPANELTSVQEPGGNCSANPVTGPCTVISYVDSSGKYQDGRRTKLTFPPSTNFSETLSYDNAGNLTSIIGKHGTSTVSSFTYTYANGTNDVAQRQSVATPSGTTYFHYDAFGRLCYYVSTSSSNACSSPPSGATSFSYDADGNRTNMVSGATTTSYAYNAADELCASSTSGGASCASPNYTWDADGNMTSSPTITSLVYNSKNQNTSRTFSGSTATFSYADADQTERVTRGNVTEATSPLGLSEENTSFGTFYIVRDNQGNPIGEYHGGTNYFTTDGLGSITNVIDGATGNTDKTYQYDPFGNVTELGSGTPTDLRYADGVWDKASSNPGAGPLYHIGTRYYDATTGRWTQQDPVGGSISDPATGDPFVYAGDDPIDNVDPSGEGFISWVEGAARTAWCAVKKHPLLVGVAAATLAAGGGLAGIGLFAVAGEAAGEEAGLSAGAAAVDQIGTDFGLEHARWLLVAQGGILGATGVAVGAHAAC
jgi:RHS repeat-associated protein